MTHTIQNHAVRHPIRHPRPAVAFTSGAVLGNGGIGAIVLVRPDAVLIHFGHNDVWDVRLAENNRKEIGTFREVFAKVKEISASGRVKTLEEDPWYADYLKLTDKNYRHKYPRPFPCGSIVLGFDRRRCESLGYEVDIATGVCRVDLLWEKKPVQVELLVELARDRLWVRCVDANGAPCQPFERIHVLPDPDTPAEFPSAIIHSEGERVGFTQVLPRVTEPGRQVPGVDHSFRLLARLPGARLGGGQWPSLDMNHQALMKEMGPLERSIVQEAGFVMAVDLDPMRGPTPGPVADLPKADWKALRTANDAAWRRYWDASAVELSDKELEAVWYRNLYFMRCAVRPGATCPGLFANWSYREVGSRWHGDYHMNYNTQQPFWVTFSSNHLELNLPYVDMVEHLMPVSEQWAREYYEMRGAYFPHSAYPVPMTLNPYPVPTWGWEICETPWTVQGLWWHYRYSMDREFLRQRAYGPIRAACRFVADYMRRPDAHGSQWGDDCYHIFPTVAPELYGLRLGFDKNADVLVDLSLTRFIFCAFQEACAVLGTADEERELLADIAQILAHFPTYPTADTAEGPIWVSAPGDHPELVHNVPASTVTIFPGEEQGLNSPPAELAMAQRTIARQQNEGGNEMVFLNLQAVRVGMLDVDRFKRQVDYCTLPNGTCADLILQGKGRYHDHTPFDAMAPMGIWFENFALPVVINECLMQSWDGIIHLFPNWPRERDAAFRTLRAVGAFLVSASLRGGEVRELTIHSEGGGECRLRNPWPGKTIEVRDGTTVRRLPSDEFVRFTTEPDHTYILQT